MHFLLYQVTLSGHHDAVTMPITLLALNSSKKHQEAYFEPVQSYHVLSQSIPVYAREMVLNHNFYWTVHETTLLLFYPHRCLLILSAFHKPPSHTLTVNLFVFLSNYRLRK